MQIGPHRIDPPMILAPMAGVTDRDFRLIVRRIGGVGVVTMEFISSRAIVHGNRRTSTVRLRNEATYVAGQLLPAAAPEPSPPWVALTSAQRAAFSERQRAMRHLMTEPLVDPEGLAEQFPRHGG